MYIRHRLYLPHKTQCTAIGGLLMLGGCLLHMNSLKGRIVALIVQRGADYKTNNKDLYDQK